MKLKCVDKALRETQIRAEITALQIALRNNGYKLGEPYDADSATIDERRMIGRIWFLGYAMNHERYAIAAGY